jgi:hypothetical protein
MSGNRANVCVWDGCVGCATVGLCYGRQVLVGDTRGVATECARMPVQVCTNVALLNDITKY